MTDGGGWHWKLPEPPSPPERHKPDRPDPFLPTGIQDVILAHYRLARLDGQSPVDALGRGMQAGAAYRSTARSDLGRMPAREEVDAADQPSLKTFWIGPRVPVTGGLEEKVRLQLSSWAEGRTGRGILVVPVRTLERFAGLEQLLRLLPQEQGLASSVVVWAGEGQSLPKFLDANPALGRFRGNDLELAVYLAGLEDADEGINLLGDAKIAGRLPVHLAALGIPTHTIPLDLGSIGKALGVAEPVLDQAGLEQLRADLDKLRGA